MLHAFNIFINIINQTKESKTKKGGVIMVLLGGILVPAKVNLLCNKQLCYYINYV